MSREIDVSNPEDLDLLDRIYLSDRGRLPEGAEPPTAEELEEIKEEVYANQVGRTLVTDASGLVGAEAVNADEPSEEEAEGEPPYEEWTNEELKEEAKARGLSGYSKMNHEELAELLYEDDTEETESEEPE